MFATTAAQAKGQGWELPGGRVAARWQGEGVQGEGDGSVHPWSSSEQHTIA